MRSHRSITRWIPRADVFNGPRAEEVKVYLTEDDYGRFYLHSPWAFVDAPNGLDTSDHALESIVRPCYSTQEKALSHADAMAPYWHRKENDVVRGRIHDALRWGHFEDSHLANAMDVSRETLYAIGRGKIKATRKQAAAALAYKGRPV